MRAMVAVLLAACGARPAPAPVPEPPLAKRDLAVAEPTPKEPTPPEEPAPYDRTWMKGGSPGRTFEAPIRRRITSAPQEIDVAARDLWSPCVRDFVQAQTPDVRRVLTAAFVRYPTSCDGDQHVVVEAPDEDAYRDRFVVLRGPLAAMRLEIVTCNTAPDESVVIVYDGRRWPGNATSEQAGGCTVTSIPDMRSVRRMLREVVDAKDAVVQVDTVEVVVSEEMKRDLRLMLDALDVLSAR